MVAAPPACENDPMSDRLGMIHAIHESPGDDLPRLAYADWLEENGEVEHAEFIRVEVALSHTDREDPGWLPLFRRELDLIRAHKDAWFGVWRSQWIHYELHRGFIEELSTSIPGSVMPHLDWLFSHHSLLDLRVIGKLEEVRPLLHHPVASILARLSIDSPQSSWSLWDPGRLGRVHLNDRPLVLSFAGHRAGPEFIDDLLASPHLGRLSWLNLSGNALALKGIGTLLDQLEAFPRLKTLRLAGTTLESSGRRRRITPNIDDFGVITLANHPAATQLEQLDIENNGVTGPAVEALLESQSLRHIKRLNIGDGPDRNERRRLRRRFRDRVELPPEESE